MNTTQVTVDRDTNRRAAARIPLEVPKTLFGKAMAWYSRRTYGAVLDPGLAMLHNRAVLRAVIGFERRVDKWSTLEPDLKALAEMASASRIGCSWCVDFGHYAGRSKGLDVSKLAEVTRWRESAVFTGV